MGNQDPNYPNDIGDVGSKKEKEVEEEVEKEEEWGRRRSSCLSGYHPQISIIISSPHPHHRRYFWVKKEKKLCVPNKRVERCVDREPMERLRMDMVKQRRGRCAGHHERYQWKGHGWVRDGQRCPEHYPFIKDKQRC